MKITRSGNKIIISGPAGCGKTTKANEMKAGFESQGKKVFISEGGDISPAAGEKYDLIIETRI